MIAFERLKILCNQQGISINTLEERLGFGKNVLYSWKKNIPTGANLAKVADYFHVSTDYLLGRTNNPHAGLTTEQRKLTVEEALDSVMSSDGKTLSDNDKQLLARLIDTYLREQE